jgi:hypothetical protein
VHDCHRPLPPPLLAPLDGKKPLGESAYFCRRICFIIVGETASLLSANWANGANFSYFLVGELCEWGELFVLSFWDFGIVYVNPIHLDCASWCTTKLLTLSKKFRIK